MDLHIPRALKIEKLIRQGKVLVIYGPRQVGKTTLIKKFLERSSLKYKYVTGDDLNTIETLSKHSLANIEHFVSDYELIAIDEAQRIPNIGLSLKLMVDNFPDRYFVISGSSALDIAGTTFEPLTGRKKVVTMLPIWTGELKDKFRLAYIKQHLGEFLIYGMYPEVVTAVNAEQKVDRLQEIAGSYLLKDVLNIVGIKRTKLILDLLKLLALQIGSEVSLNELANNLNISVQTVQKYLDVLEETFVIFKLSGFSRNLRKEISKSSKYYFYDVGIRNAVISNFSPLSSRKDKGALWENFIIVERLKKHFYTNFRANYYFWRTYDKQEIDWIEEYDGTLHAYEFKFKSKNVKAPEAWINAYKDATFSVVSSENFTDFAT